MKCHSVLCTAESLLPQPRPLLDSALQRCWCVFPCADGPQKFINMHLPPLFLHIFTLWVQRTVYSCLVPHLSGVQERKRGICSRLVSSTIFNSLALRTL